MKPYLNPLPVRYARAAVCAVALALASTLTAQVPPPRGTDGDGRVKISGELKQWHKVTLDLAGPFARETDSKPNPFTDQRLTVTFAHESGTPTYTVPGYFAADGRAGETGAEAGNVWRAHLSPDKAGRWTYRVSFTRGPGIATAGGAGEALAPYDGKTGTFDIAPTDKTGRDFRAKGRLQYVGGHHLRFAGTGEYFLKAGPDSPETFLGATDFDNTTAGKPAVPLKTWAPHVRDWRDGDPTWRGGRGKGLIGSLNYLAAEGLNSFSFLPYNAGGDGDNVWPFVARNDKFHYDCSKLDQWEVVFAHAQRLGLYLHFKLQETEIDDQRRQRERAPIVVPEALDGGATGPERKLYLRELIARFGHHLALNWNLGEENTQTPEEQRAMAQFIADIDPYSHLRVIHSYPNEQELVYEPLLGNQSTLTGASLQNMWHETHACTVKWINASAAAGRPWVVANDEQGSARSGVPPDPGYKGFDGTATEEGYPSYDLHGIRRYTLWGNLMAGGAGVEYYFGYRLAENDLVAENFRSRDQSWDYCRIALEFFDREKIPFWKMKNADELVDNPAHDNSRYCLALPGELYLVYLPQGGGAKLDLSGVSRLFSVAWFNPREGGALRHGQEISGGAAVALTAPDTEDWLAVVRPAHKSLAVGATPESVVRGFGGKLYVTLMGTVRKLGDGDGKIVVVDGDRVSDFATGLDDPKGIVFVGGRLITTDFDKVWAFDAQGNRTLLAGPDAFPIPPRFLNDVAVETGSRNILVTDMGDLPSMSSAPGVFWPIDSEEAKKRQPFGRVYRITLDGKVSVAIDHDPAMPNPNGVDALEDGRILVAEFFRGTLLEWKAGKWREITSGHRSGDGIVHDAAGNLYLTEVRTGHVWHIRADTGEKRLLATLQSAADLILEDNGGRRQLIVPDSKAGLLVFIPLDAAVAGPALEQKQLAFPGAQGFGAYAKGGRGGRVLHVTNLNDSGAGSLRWAVEQAGPRTIVFDLSGTIELKTGLDITNPFITIAGQTAPGDGICLKGETVRILTHDVVVRYLRFRLGDGRHGQGSLQGKDALSLSVGTDIIVDHCSASWSLDEVLSASTREPTLTRITVQWCFITEGLNPSRHGYGSLIRGTGGAQYSFLHNLYAHNLGRNPRPGNYDTNPHDKDPEGLLLDFRNNVIYNWGGGHAGYNQDSVSVTRLNYVGNYLLPGADSEPTGIAYSTGSPFNRYFFAGNAFAGKVPEDPWSLVRFSPKWSAEEIRACQQNQAFPTGPVTLMDASTAFTRVLEGGGAILPKRDPVDRRIVNDVKNRTGRIIKSQDEVGGWPELKPAPAPQDTDRDGMPDTWEIAHKLNPQDPTDGNQVGPDGYTQLERFLNEAAPAATTPARAPRPFDRVTLLAHWPFDDKSGTVVTEKVAGRSGELTNADAAKAWIAGPVGGALQLDGKDDRIFVPHDPAFDFGLESFSVAFWMRWQTGAVPHNQHIVAKGDYESTTPGETGRRWEVFTRQDAMSFTIDDDVTASRIHVSLAPFISGEWVHVVAIRDVRARRLRLYANGVALSPLHPDKPGVDGIDRTGDISNPQRLTIGDAVRRDNPLAGSLDDLRVYLGVLTDQQIAALAKR